MDWTVSEWVRIGIGVALTAVLAEVVVTYTICRRKGHAWRANVDGFVCARCRRALKDA